jgi:hypothetical protein
MLFPPIAHLEAIDRGVLNRALVAWQHKMGPWERPDFGKARFHGLFHNGELVAIAATDQLIAETCAGLGRHEALELGRLCAVRPGLCRPMLRLWREFIFPAYGYRWAVSYQDAIEHSGNLYRFDGWVKLGTSSSGTDQRSGAKGRRKVIWGWSATPGAMLLRKEAA